MSELTAALALSLQIAVCATLLCVLTGTPLAWWIAHRKPSGRGVIEALLTLPLVLPPTVVGYFLLVLFGSRGWVGRWLWRWFGYTPVFRFEGAVLASAVVAFPLLYLPAKAAFASVSRDLEETATLLGASRLQVFLQVSLPLARRGIAAGLILAFARALGEFGATMMVYGWTPTRVTLPISVYVDFFYDGSLPHATAAVALLTLLSLLLIVAYNRALRE